MRYAIIGNILLLKNLLSEIQIEMDFFYFYLLGLSLKAQHWNHLEDEKILISGSHPQENLSWFWLGLSISNFNSFSTDSNVHKGLMAMRLNGDF